MKNTLVLKALTNSVVSEHTTDIIILVVPKKHVFIASSNSEAFASELLEINEEMFHY